MILQVGIFHEIEDLINTYGDITGMYNSVDIYIYKHICLYFFWVCLQVGDWPPMAIKYCNRETEDKAPKFEGTLFSDKAISIDICNDVICIIDP